MYASADKRRQSAAVVQSKRSYGYIDRNTIGEFIVKEVTHVVPDPIFVYCLRAQAFFCSHSEKLQSRERCECAASDTGAGRWQDDGAQLLHGRIAGIAPDIFIYSVGIVADALDAARNDEHLAVPCVALLVCVRHGGAALHQCLCGLLDDGGESFEAFIDGVLRLDRDVGEPVAV